MRRLLRGALLVSLGGWWVACSDAGTGPAPPAPPPLEPNRPPTAVAAIPSQSARVGDTVTLTVSSYFADPDGDRLVYDARSSDPGVATVSAAGDTVTVVAVRRGAAAITVTAADPDGLEAAQPFDVTVLNSGPAAAGRIPDLELPLDREATVEVSPYFTDPDGDALTYRAESSDPAVAGAETSGSAVTVRARARGSATVTVTAADPGGLEVALAFEVTVPNSGPAATGSLADIELALGEETTVEAASLFTDPDGDALAYRAESSDPAVAAAGVAGSELTIRALARGAATITVTAADPDGLEAALAFEVTVPNSGPAGNGSLADLELHRGDEATVELSSRFTDPDGDALTYRAESSDPAVAAAGVAGSEVTIRALARGAATITVTAADPDGLEAALDFEVAVPNSGPVAGGSLADLELRRGDEATVELSSRFTDPDGDALAYRAESSDPAVAAAGVAGSEVTIRALARGAATITVTAADPDGLEAALDFEVAVPNSGPAASGSLADLELRRGDEATVELSSRFTDPDGDALTYRAESSDPTVAAAASAGSEVTMRALARGVATITVTAADPDGLEAALSFEVTVPNSGPGATGTLADIELAGGEETTVEVASLFTDPDGDALTWAASSSNPAVAAADASGSAVTVRALAPGSATITVMAADPDGLEAALAFEVTVPVVTVPNGAPESTGPMPDIELALSGRATVDASAYFRDPDGDRLRYDATSSNPDVATATASGQRVTVEAVSRGASTITVTATDPAGLSAALSFQVAVTRNRPPGVTATLPDLDMEAGEEEIIVLSRFFADPDGDGLTYRASSSDPDVATATVSGQRVTVEAVSRGASTITVTATDPAGLSAALSFQVAVSRNRPPGITATLPDLDMEAGEEEIIVLSRFFADPDGDALTFSATSSDETRVGLDASADTIWIRGASEGSARITVTATDALGLSTAQAFDVTVRTFVSPFGFDIRLGFASSVSASARNVIRQAVSTWEGVLANSELSDVRFDRRITCGGLTTDEVVGTVDDLLILFAAVSIDGPSGTLGYAGPCVARSSNSLPVVGRVILDSEDIDRIPATTGLLDLVIHEIAHVLGFGVFWGRFGLLADRSSVTPGADTHFTGAGAISAFNAAGGASYTGAKVPVQNEDPGPDAHWRASIFPDETMEPSQSTYRRESLSAITIRSLADLGYTVNAALADPYSISLPDIPPGRPVQAEAGRILYLGDDILRVPIQVVDDEGRVLRVIPPR